MGSQSELLILHSGSTQIPLLDTLEVLKRSGSVRVGDGAHYTIADVKETTLVSETIGSMVLGAEVDLSQLRPSSTIPDDVAQQYPDSILQQHLF